jgi:hypothetical protein
MSDFKNTLGEADRTIDFTESKTHTYDNKGIIFWEKIQDKKPSGKVTEVQINYVLSDMGQKTPSGTFSGSLSIEKIIVNKAISVADLKNALKKWTGGAADNIVQKHIFRYSNGTVYIWFQFNNEETELQWLSIGPDKK